MRILVAELRRWQPKLNLVSPGSLDQVWSRHIDDSLQLSELGRGAGTWIDLGSGGGFPGLVVAAVEPRRPTTLVESDERKCAYLRMTSGRMGVTPRIHHGRIEDGVSLPSLPEVLAVAQSRTGRDGGSSGALLLGAPREEDVGCFQRGDGASLVVSARALAPLDRLLGYAAPFLATGAIGLFPKGRTAEAELTEARKSWIFDVDVVPSRTDSAGRILRIRDFAGPRT